MTDPNLQAAQPTSSATRDKNNQDGDLPVVGHRRVFYFNDAGQPAYQVYELTAGDFLDPQPGDEFDHGEVHDNSARILAGMIKHHYRYSPTASAHVQSKLVWPDAALAQPAPDVVIVNHLSDPHRHRPILDLAAEQTADGIEGQVSVRTVFEITSPLLATSDLETKRDLYERAQVPEYWIIDTGLRPNSHTVRYTIVGYRLQDGSYQEITPSGGLRWESQACRLWLEVSADRQSFLLGDLRTGKALPKPAKDDNPLISAQDEASRRAQSIAGQLKL